MSPSLAGPLGPRVETSTALSTFLDGMRAVGSPRPVDVVLQLMTTAAATALRPVDAASVVMSGRSGPVTAAATDEVASQLDTLQFAHGGPGVAVLDDATAEERIDDPADTARWPGFVTAALVPGPVHSMLSVCLRVGADDPLAVLNLYAAEPRAFDPATIRAAHELAASGALALALAREQERTANLQHALISNRDIATAIGILMSRHVISRDEAFARLRRASQRRNVKVREVAADVIDTGELSDDRPTSPSRSKHRAAERFTCHVHP